MEKELEEAREVMKNPDPKKVLKVKKNPFYKVSVKTIEVEMTLVPWLDEDIKCAIKDSQDDFSGWFKLQSSKRLPPEVALDVYRPRVGIEHLISSINSVVNLKPLRVWNKASVRGAMLLGLIAQLIVSMVRNDLEPDIIRKWDDGKLVDIEHKLSEDDL